MLQEAEQGTALQNKVECGTDDHLGRYDQVTDCFCAHFHTVVIEDSTKQQAKSMCTASAFADVLIHYTVWNITKTTSEHGG